MKHCVSYILNDCVSFVGSFKMSQLSLPLMILLGHPWIVDEQAAPDKPLDPAVLSRLKQFSQMNKIKKMALRVRINKVVDILLSFFNI